MADVQTACPPITPYGLRLVVLRVHNAVLLNLRLVVVVHRRHEFEDRRWAGAGEALDDVCRSVSRCFCLSVLFARRHTYTAPASYILYSCVMVPLASIMACFAACTTLSGVSFGQLMMTDFCGATAMVKEVRSATKEAVSAKRMLLGVVEVLGLWISSGG